MAALQLLGRCGVRARVWRTPQPPTPEFWTTRSGQKTEHAQTLLLYVTQQATMGGADVVIVQVSLHPYDQSRFMRQPRSTLHCTAARQWTVHSILCTEVSAGCERWQARGEVPPVRLCPQSEAEWKQHLASELPVLVDFTASCECCVWDTRSTQAYAKPTLYWILL